MKTQREALVNEWDELRKKLKIARVIFDNEYRDKHKNHICKTKVYSTRGNWFCQHLTVARYKKFKKDIDKEETIISELSCLTD